MKSIKLISVPIVIQGVEDVFDYRAMLKALLESPADPEKGAGIDEVRKSLRALDAIDAADDVLELEDADFEYVLGRVRNARFVSANRVYIDFVESFQNAA